MSKTFYKFFFEKTKKEYSDTISLKMFIDLYFNNFYTVKKISENFEKENIFSVIKKSLIDNPFVNNDELDENETIEFICKAQKFKMLMIKYVRKFKYKKYTVYDINQDLLLNDLSDFPENQKIHLVENKTIYKFRLTDLLNIITKSLTNYVDIYIVEPSEIKNPYTNLPFSMNNLYNIFFKVKQSNFLMPIFFYKFFIVNFDLKQFLIHNESELQLFAINDFCNSGYNIELLESIYHMFDQYQYLLTNISIRFEKDFKKLVNTFRPFLKLYYISSYSCNTRTKFEAKKNLKKKLFDFNETNIMYRKVLFNQNIFTQNNSIFQENYNILTNTVNYYPQEYAIPDNNNRNTRIQSVNNNNNNNYYENLTNEIISNSNNDNNDNNENDNNENDNNENDNNENDNNENDNIDIDIDMDDDNTNVVVNNLDNHM